MDDARPRPSIAAALEREAVVWLSTIRPDGAPHLVPLWFVWDGRAIQARSKPDAQKVQNLRANPRAMVAIGQPGASFDVELFEALAELPGQTEALPGQFASKYDDLASAADVAMDQFGAIYCQPIVLRPTRWLGWGGPGWKATDEVPAAG
jgi:PPOX class probable F420-dependent enzyme